MCILLYLIGIFLALTIGSTFLYREANKEGTKYEKIEHFNQYFWIIVFISLLSWIGLILYLVLAFRYLIIAIAYPTIDKYWTLLMNKIF